MKTQTSDLICVVVLCVILTLGLWPFHSPENQVTWSGDRDGLRVGKHGTVISSSAFQVTSLDSGASASVEVWLQPRQIWDDGTFLAFFDHRNPYQFLLRQHNAGLELRTGIRNDTHPASTARLCIANALRRSGPVFLTITSGPHGTAVYTNGILFKTAPQFRLSPNALTGRLVLGDSPGQPDNWSGQFFGLAIYYRELTAIQVLRHYETWTQWERPEIFDDEGNTALYLLDERAGNVVHDHSSTGVNLYIPQQYMVLNKIFLDPFWEEFSMSWSYWSSAVKNIVGFIPFGFCLFACLSAHKVSRAHLTTIILGTLVSLTMEVLQAYLPTRNSGTTDILTNSLGTYIGVIACRVVGPILAALFPWLPLVASPRS